MRLFRASGVARACRPWHDVEAENGCSVADRVRTGLRRGLNSPATVVRSLREARQAAWRQAMVVLIMCDGNPDMFSELIAVSSNLTHLFVDTSVVIALSAFVAHPGRDILDNDERRTVPKVFAALRRFQGSPTTSNTNLTCHI